MLFIVGEDVLGCSSAAGDSGYRERGRQDKWNKIIGGKLLRSRPMEVVWSRGVLAVLGMQGDCWKAYK